MAGKYDHIDFTPPKAVAEAAERGLKLRREQEGDKAGLTNEEAAEQGIGSGVQRAVNLKNRDSLSPETINDMIGFFARFGDLIKKARKLTKKEEQLESNMFISDLLWGGQPGEAWAKRIKAQMAKADQKKEASYVPLVLERILGPKHPSKRSIVSSVTNRAISQRIQALRKRNPKLASELENLMRENS